LIKNQLDTNAKLSFKPAYNSSNAEVFFPNLYHASYGNIPDPLNPERMDNYMAVWNGFAEGQV